jgi:hypothetical protein
MGRLIDAEALKKDILSQSILGETIGKVLDRYIHVVDSQPTVFDVDKVVEQLEKKKQTHKRVIEYEKKNGTITEEFQQRKAVEVLENAIQIVKGGGVDGN